MARNQENPPAEKSAAALSNDPNIDDILETFPEPEREKVIQVIEMSQSYRGPVMPPQLMRELEKIIPGGAERVLRLSEKEQDHRHYILKCKVGADRWQIKASLIGGIFAYVFLIAGLLYCATFGYTSGTIALGSIGAFGVITHIIRLPKKDNERNMPKKPPAKHD